MSDELDLSADGSVGESAEPDTLSAASTTTTPAERWKSRISASRRYRDKRRDDAWLENVNYRVQKPYGVERSADANDKLSSPEDWSRTKQKTAQLMYQVPQIQAAAGRPEMEPFAPIVTAAINDVLKKECGAASVLDECLADVVNAAGVMAAVVGIDQRFEMVEVQGPPQIVSDGYVDPMTGMYVPPQMAPGEMQSVERLVSQKFTLDRISPACLLWPPEFRLSDWDRAPWLGYDTWIAKTNVLRTWRSKISPDQEASIKSSAPPDLLSKDIDDRTAERDTTDYVRVTVIWARGSEFDQTITHPECFKRIVFVDGLTDPVEDEKTNWQEWVEESLPPPPPGMAPGQMPQGAPGQPAPPPPTPIPAHYRGITKNPIRVATLTYVSDLGVPPSDTEAGRPQIREMIRGRSQMIRQRDHSIPLRWYNTNMIDDEIVQAIRLGTWQDMIPVNGPGGNVVGEVARASFPRENFEFQSIVSRDLDRAWSLSNNQLGSSQSGRRSAREIETIQQATDIRLDYEKAKVSTFVVGIAEVLFGLMQMFMDAPRYVQIVGQQGATVLQQVDKNALSGVFAFDYRVNSSDRVDINNRMRGIKELYNLAANSPTINRQALEKEIIEIHGLDPAKILKAPPPPKEEPPNVSYRFSGEDLLNPMAVAILLKSEKVTPKDIEAAAKMIQDAIRQASTPQQLPNPGGGPPNPGGPPQPDNVEPPQPPELVTKRLSDGTRMM